MKAQSGPQPNWDDLVAVAMAARSNAYAPYSRFRVGAALMASDGSVHSGANVENASYGLTICAERSAYFTAVSRGHREFVGLAVVTDAPDLTPPCGACRQVAREFNTELRIILASVRGKRRHTDLASLLPESFGPDSLT